MSLPTSITLNVGSPAADVIYTEQSVNGSKATYTAPSPTGDLSGRPILTASHEATKNKVVRTVVSFNTPIFDTEGVSLGYIKTDVVQNRPASAPIALSQIEFEKASEFLTTSNISQLAAASL